MNISESTGAGLQNPNPVQGPKASVEIPLSIQVISSVDDFGALIGSGLWVSESASVVSKLQANPTLKDAWAAVSADIAKGLLLDEAMKKHPDLFDDSLIAFVAVAVSLCRSGIAIEERHNRFIAEELVKALSRYVNMEQDNRRILANQDLDLPAKENRLFANVLGQSISSGVPVMPALDLSAKLLSAPFKQAIGEIKVKMAQGYGLAESMDNKLFDPFLLALVDVGERTGDLDKTLLRFASRQPIH